jgi:hypothetical protein
MLNMRILQAAHTAAPAARGAQAKHRAAAAATDASVHRGSP